MMKNMNVYIVIYEQQRDKVYNDMQEALHGSVKILSQIHFIRQ